MENTSSYTKQIVTIIYATWIYCIQLYKEYIEPKCSLIEVEMFSVEKEKEAKA